jgi:hypothetical protein
VELGFARVLGLYVGHQSGDIVFHGIACEWLRVSNGSRVYFRMTIAERRGRCAGRGS